MTIDQMVALIGILFGSSLLVSIINAFNKAQNRRRELYSRGVFLLSEREELYYRILRRGKKDSDDLVANMHSNQMNIQEHLALIQVDSYWLGREYKKRIVKFRKENEEKFRDAWQNPLKNRFDSVPVERRIDSSEMLKSYASYCRIRLNPLLSPINTLFIRWWYGK